MNKSTIFRSWIFLLVLALASCGPDKQKNEEEEQVFDVVTEEKTDKFGETFYQIFSPEELFAFIKDGKLKYDPTLLNPIENASQYVDVKSKELNFGVYTADLAYAAAFNKYQESLNNIESVRVLSEEIDISSVFDEALNNRIQNIFENSDSLLNVTNASYYKIVNYLEENQRGRTLALIATGGWIESLYIFTHLVDQYQEGNVTIQRIADQKLTFENLMQYLKKHENDNYVKKVIADLQKLDKAFAQLQEKNMEPPKETASQSNVIVVGGSKKIVITQAQFNAIKAALKEVRNKITGN